jgi:hypothetical protein
MSDVRGEVWDIITADFNQIMKYLYRLTFLQIHPPTPIKWSVGPELLEDILTG